MEVLIKLNPDELLATINNGTLKALVGDVEKTREKAKKEANKNLDKWPKKEEKAEAPKKTPAKSTKKENSVQLNDIMSAFKRLNSKSNRAELKKIVEATGAKNVSSIPEEKYPKVMEALKKFEG